MEQLSKHLNIKSAGHDSKLIGQKFLRDQESLEDNNVLKKQLRLPLPSTQEN